MKMNKKIVIGLAVLAAFMMLAVPLIIVQSGSDANNPIPADSITVDFTKEMDYGTYGTASNNGLGNSITVNYDTTSKMFVLTGSLKAQNLTDTTSTFYKLWTTNTEYAYGIVFEVTVPNEGDKIKIGTNGAVTEADSSKKFQSLLYVKASESKELVAITYTPTGSENSVVYKFDVSALYEASVLIGSTTSYYYKLVDAVAAAQPQDSGNIATVTVLKDATTTGVLAFTKAGQYTFDIGTNTVTKGEGTYMFTVGGENPPQYPIDTINTSAQLTIIGTGNIVGLNTTFRSYGTMIVGDASTGAGPNVTIYNTSPEYSIFKVEEGSYLTVNGGTFSLSTVSGNAVTRIMQSYGTTVINGGTFNADVQLWKYGNSTTQFTSTITINDGTFEDVVIKGVAGSGELASTDKITIKQGTFKGTISEVVQGGTIEISNGTFENLSCLPYVKTDSSVTLGKSYTIAQDSTATVYAGTTIIVPSEITLTVAGTLTNNGTIINNGTIDINNTTENKAKFVQTGGSITSTATKGGNIVVEAKWTSGGYDSRAIAVQAGTFEKQNVTAKNMSDNAAFMTVTGATAAVTVQNNVFTMERPNGIGVDNIGSGKAISFVGNKFVSATVSEQKVKIESCIFIQGTIGSTITISGTDLTGAVFDTEEKGYSALVFFNSAGSDNVFTIGGLNSAVQNLTVKTDISSIGIKRGPNTSKNTVLEVSDNISMNKIAVATAVASSNLCGVLKIAAEKTLTVTGELYNYGTIVNNGVLDAEGAVFVITKGSAAGDGKFVIADSGSLFIGGTADSNKFIGSNGKIVLSTGATVTISKNATTGFESTIEGDATINGNFALTTEAKDTLTVASGSTLTIAQGKTLEIRTDASLINNGTIAVSGILMDSFAADATAKQIDNKGQINVLSGGQLKVGYQPAVTGVNIDGKINVTATGLLQCNDGSNTKLIGGNDAVINLTAGSIDFDAKSVGGAVAYTLNTASKASINAFPFKSGDSIIIDGELTAVDNLTISTGVTMNVNGIVIIESAKSIVITGTGAVTVSSDGAITGGTIDFTDATLGSKVLTVENGGMLTTILDGSDAATSEQPAKPSKMELKSVVAGVNGIIIAKGSVVIDGTYSTDADGTITITSGTATITGTVDEGVKIVVPAGVTVVIPEGGTLEFDAGSSFENSGTINFESPTSSTIIYEEGSTVNGVEIEVTTKQTEGGVIVAIIITLKTANADKLLLKVDGQYLEVYYVEAFEGDSYADALAGIEVESLKSRVSFDGWYNNLNEKVTTGMVVGSVAPTLTAKFTETPREGVTPHTPSIEPTVITVDETGGYDNTTMLVAAVAMLVVAIFVLGYVVIVKRK